MDYTYDDEGNAVDPNATASDPEYVSSTAPKSGPSPLETGLKAAMNFHAVGYQPMGNMPSNQQLLYSSTPEMPPILSLTRGPMAGN